ncbi:MAG: LysM peptidoglycan-binding domain-containing M23 family metallopeptidase, partial [Chloroflexota bacterium]
YDAESSGQLQYTVVPGDTLFLVATRYGLEVEELMEINDLSDTDFIVAGQLLEIPIEVNGLSPSFKIIPDSELVYGPTVGDFHVGDFLRRFYPQSTLLQYKEIVEGRPLNGAAIVDLVAVRFSVNPRLLLAMVEYRSGWVSRYDPNFENNFYPMGFGSLGSEGLYDQLSRAANLVNFGMYGRREGGLRTIEFRDKTQLVIDPTVNHATAGIQTWLAAHDNATVGSLAQEAGPDGFFVTYENIFGNPFGFALEEPLLPNRLEQPDLILPWERDIPWYFTGGPHGGWAAGSAWAALDFGPDKEKRGCYLSEAWTVAAADGLVVYSDFGGVLLDLDGDGDPGTGWLLVYWHIDQAGRVEANTRLDQGEQIGHPSCEGGFSNGTHLHFARRYNGYWIAADGDIPFVLDGWVSSGAGREYDGYLVKGDESREACVCAEEDINELIR